MRFFYADPGLHDFYGHHAADARLVLAALRARGIPVTVLAYRDIVPALQAELGAQPFFRSFAYWSSDGDPVCGWLNAFHIAAQAMREDLARLADIGADDVVLVPLTSPAHLMGVVAWLGERATERTPRVATVLWNPGVELRQAADGVTVSLADPRVNPRGLLYRFAALQAAQLKAPRLRLMHNDRVGVAALQALTGQEVRLVPVPLAATAAPRNRAGRRPITLGIVGHQRNDEKGYQHVPALAEALLRGDPSLRILAQNSVPEHMPETQAALRALAGREPRLALEEGSLDAGGWPRLLDRIDLMLCPYDPAAYLLAPSGAHAEAIANAIPAIVPAGTGLERLMQEVGGGGVAFERNEPAAILAATQRALASFDALAVEAAAAARTFALRHGPNAYLDAILAP